MIEFKRNTHHAPREVNLTPLIDILFNLLIFMLITAVFTAQGVLLNLPEAATTQAIPGARFEVTLTAGDEIKVGGAVCTLSRLREIFDTKLADPHWDGTEKIVINADKQASVGLLIRLMDTARTAGLDNVMVATGGRGK